MKSWDSVNTAPWVSETPGHKKSREKKKLEKTAQADVSEDDETQIYDELRALEKKLFSVPLEQEEVRINIQNQIKQECLKIGEEACLSHNILCYFYNNYVTGNINTDDLNNDDFFLAY